MPECVILVGLPGAGKTSFYRERFNSTHTHLSKDLWPDARGREARQLRELEALLAAGRSVVIDNINATVEDRAALIAIAQRRGARTIGYFIDVTTRQAVARNQERSGKARVPNVAIFAAAKRLSAPTPAEGFDELYRVELTPDRRFAIGEVRNK